MESSSSLMTELGNKVTVKFDVFPFGLGDSSSSTAASHEVLVDGLESSQIICLLCTKVVTAPLSLSFSPSSSCSTEYNLRQLKENIAEIALIDSAYLHASENHLGFCECCQEKIQHLREFYGKFLHWRDELVTLSSEISYLILQTNTRFLWGESAENQIDESFYHEWNVHRIQQMLQSKLQIVNMSGNIDSQPLCVNPSSPAAEQLDELGQKDKGGVGVAAEIDSEQLEFTDMVAVDNVNDEDVENFETSSRQVIHVIHGAGAQEQDSSNVLDATTITTRENQTSDQNDKTSDILLLPQSSANPNDSSQPVFRCDSCNKVFSRGYSLRLHVRTHTGEQSFVCERCNKKFTSRTTLKAHQKVHMEKKILLTCPICGKTMGQKRTFDAHLHRHHMTDYLVSNVACDICRKSFTTPLLLMTHMNVHRGEFQCSMQNCKKAFNTCHSLEEHEKKIHQSSVRVYDCDFCASVFEDENSLNKHLPSHTTPKSSLCDHCGKCFPSRSLLQAHLRLHKNIEYKCKVCEKNFCSASNLKCHQRLHTGEKPFQCPNSNCNQSFAQKASLNLHMRKHSGVNPFICSFCDTSTGFTYKLAFRQHLATKHPEIYLESKKFLCKVCWKNFNSETDLTEHEVTHEKHKCKLCNRQFKMLIHLKEHLLRHAALKPFKCRLCLGENKAFLRRKHLIDHILKTHPGVDAEAAADAENVTYIVHISS